jgi:hypothetical protein
LASAAAPEDWHNFFALVGSASATLIGAMFVVVSIGSGILTQDRAGAIRTFLTSTVTHLSAALFGSVLALVPAPGETWRVAAIGLAGLAGLVYVGGMTLTFHQHPHTDHSDRFWYTLFPLAGYGLLVAAAAVALRGGTTSIELFALALALLVAAGIRNAWDMIVFLITRPRDSGG